MSIVYKRPRDPIALKKWNNVKTLPDVVNGLGEVLSKKEKKKNGRDNLLLETF